jgi:hypothetical protein
MNHCGLKPVSAQQFIHEVADIDYFDTGNEETQYK